VNYLYDGDGRRVAKVGGPRGAAARLGVKRTTLHYKMKRLGIAPPSENWKNETTS
jgi:hypothetical protein